MLHRRFGWAILTGPCLNARSFAVAGRRGFLCACAYWLLFGECGAGYLGHPVVVQPFAFRGVSAWRGHAKSLARSDVGSLRGASRRSLY